MEALEGPIRVGWRFSYIGTSQRKVRNSVLSGPPKEARPPRKGRGTKDHRAPNHISKMVLPTVHLGPPAGTRTLWSTSSLAAFYSLQAPLPTSTAIFPLRLPRNHGRPAGDRNGQHSIRINDQSRVCSTSAPSNHLLRCLPEPTRFAPWLAMRQGGQLYKPFAPGRTAPRRAFLTLDSRSPRP